MTALVDLSDISFAWSGETRPAVQLKHLQFNRGEHTLVVGASGCGKTTLLSLISGIATPQQGSIVVAGTRVDHLGGARRDRIRADHIGIVFQMFNLLPYLSVVENVMLAGQFSASRRQRAEQLSGSMVAEANRLLDRLQLGSQYLHRAVSDLSVGQQQRVAAARALFGRPSLLLADEPTSALDARNRDYFIGLLKEECKEAGSTLLMVSHDIGLSGSFSRTLDFSEINLALQRENIE